MKQGPGRPDQDRISGQVFSHNCWCATTQPESANAASNNQLCVVAPAWCGSTTMARCR